MMGKMVDGGWRRKGGKELRRERCEDWSTKKKNDDFSSINHISSVLTPHYRMTYYTLIHQSKCILTILGKCINV